MSANSLNAKAAAFAAFVVSQLFFIGQVLIPRIE